MQLIPYLSCWIKESPECYKAYEVYLQDNDYYIKDRKNGGYTLCIKHNLDVSEKYISDRIHGGYMPRDGMVTVADPRCVNPEAFEAYEAWFGSVEDQPPIFDPLPDGRHDIGLMVTYLHQNYDEHLDRILDCVPVAYWVRAPKWARKNHSI